MSTLPAASNSSLAGILERPDNSFNAVRLAAALAVVVTHSFLLVFTYASADPLAWAPYDLGATAVNVFFVLSGLMLSRSFDLRPDWRAFAAARLLRIFPALIVAGIVVGWVLVPFIVKRPLAEYFTDPETLLYPFTSVFMFEGAHLKGAFLNSTHPGDMDLPLWTIKYELFAYLCFGLVSVLGLLKSRFTAAAACVAFGLALVTIEAMGLLQHSPLGSIIRFGFCFLTGVVLYRFRDRVQVLPWLTIPILIGGLLLTPTVLAPVAWIVALGYLALCIASRRIPLVTRATNRWDISFGVYVYAWPVQQLLMEFEPTRSNVVLHIVASLAATTLLAILSWVLVEAPALRLKRLFGRRRAARAAARAAETTVPPPETSAKT